MTSWGIGVLGLLAGIAVVPAWAERTEVLYEFRSWVVEGVTTDDNTFACNARVSLLGDSFSLRPLLDKAVRLEFYSDEWEFGEGDAADIQVQVDSRTPRDFSDATLLQSSVYVDLRDPEEGASFLKEIAGGTKLYLRSADGTDVRNYSLFGSSAAIEHLVDCSKAPVRDRNPFN